MDTERDIVAKAGVGAMMAAIADGTLGDIDPDQMYEMAGAMSAAPEEVAKHLGRDPLLGKAVTPEQLGSNILETYYDAVFASELGSVQMESADERDAMIRHRHDEAYRYSGLTPEEVGRLEYDRDNGDLSAHLRVQERFYLG